MPGWVAKIDRAVAHITVPVPTLRVRRSWHEGVGLDEFTQSLRVEPCLVVHQARVGHIPLERIAEVGLRDCAYIVPHGAEGQVSLLAEDGTLVIEDGQCGAEACAEPVEAWSSSMKYSVPSLRTPALHQTQCGASVAMV